MATQAKKVTIAIPDDAPPGTLLCVPVGNGEEQVKVRVPKGMGPGSTIFLTRPDGAEDWDVAVGKVVPLQPDADQDIAQEDMGGNAALGEDEDYNRKQQELAQRFANTDEQSLLAQRYAEQERLRQQEEQQHLQQEQQRQRPQQQQEEVPIGPKIVRLDTTVGRLDIIVRSDWAPHGARRLMELASSGDLENLAFYRSIEGCIAQFGLPTKRKWSPVPDDQPTGVPFLLGAVSLAASGENSRKSTVVICAGDMTHCLGSKPWETPVGALSEASLEVLERIDSSYGEIAEFGGSGPNVGCINAEGNAYLRREFPRLTYVRSASVLDYGQEHKPHGRLGADAEDLGPPLAPDGGLQRDAARAAQNAARAAEEAALAARSVMGGLDNGPGSESFSAAAQPPPEDLTARKFWELNQQAQEEAQRQIEEAHLEAQRKQEQAKRMAEEKKRQLKQQEQQLEMMKQQAQQQLEMQVQQMQVQAKQAQLAREQAKLAQEQAQQQQQKQQEQQLMLLKQQAQQQLEAQCQQRTSHGKPTPPQTPQQVSQQMQQQIAQNMLQQGQQQAPQMVPQQTPQQMFQQTPPQVPQQVAQQMAQPMFQQQPQYTPQPLAQQVPMQQMVQQQVPQHIPPVQPQLQPMQQGGSMQFSVARGGGSLTFNTVQPTGGSVQAPVNVVLPPAAQAAHVAQMQLAAAGCGQSVGQAQKHTMGVAGIPGR